MHVTLQMAGAMSEEGKSLEEMKTFLTDAIKEIGTISISLSPCSIPGKPPSFTITEDIVEFGLGIHGEAGVSQIKMSTAENLVEQMIEHVKNSSYLPPLDGKEVALIINNLGGTSNLELPIVARETIKCLNKCNAKVLRCYVGTFVTSIEMAGVSLTIMILNEDRLKYLDAPCDAPGWSKYGQLNDEDNLTISCTKSTETDGNYDEKAEGNGLTIFKCVKAACTDLISNENKLNDLDRAAGDGDTGTTLARGAKCIVDKLADVEHVSYPINTVPQFCLALAKDIEATMGGSSGALISLLFTASANAFNDEISMSTFCDGLQRGINAMKKYGGAEEGDRTMLDALLPALTAMKRSIDNKVDVRQTLQAVAKESRAGATATTAMNAKAGRASYVSNTRLTQPDPGAYAVALVFEAIEKAFVEQ